MSTSAKNSWTRDWTTAELVCFGSLSSMLLVSSSFNCFSLFRWSHTTFTQSLHFMHMFHVSYHLQCCSRCFRLLHSLHLLLHHLSDLLAFLTCPTLSTSLMSWITSPAFHEELGPWPKMSEPNDHFITEACVEHTQEFSGEQRFPDDTMTSPPATHFLTRAKDEPITLKNKACRLVCRLQSIILERRDP